MKFAVIAVLVLGSFAAAKAQSCITPDDVKQMIARVEGPASAPNKKLKEELIKMAQKERDLLQEVVNKQQAKPADRDKLDKLYQNNTNRLCQIMKTNGWPTSAMVDNEGVFAAFQILKNGGTFETQRDLLQVIVAAIKKDAYQKPEFAGLYDRLRVSAGRKQIFGTQAVASGGFLILYPIEDEAKLDARRAEFGLGNMVYHIRNLERTYGKPLIRARQPPTSELSKPLTESLSKAIDSTILDGEEIDPGDVIKVDTSLVSLNVSVFNSKLKTFVGELTKEDFRVLENNEEQTVSYFASTAVPFDLVLVIDLSSSTNEKRDLIRTSTLRFIEAARATDRLAIVTFSDQSKLVSPLTLDRGQLAASVATMEGSGGSHVWDAVKFALDEVLGPKTLERRRAVVLMSDGVDGSLIQPGSEYGSSMGFAELVEQVRQTDALIVPIYLDSEDDNRNPYTKNAYENARRTLNLLASESGGFYYRARKLADLNGVYEQVINDLGKVYSLGYKSTSATRDNSWRRVQVSIPNHPDVTARTRPGYYAQ